MDATIRPIRRMQNKRASLATVKNEIVTPIKLKIPQVSVKKGLKQAMGGSMGPRSPRARFYYKPDTAAVRRDSSTGTLDRISRNI